MRILVLTGVHCDAPIVRRTLTILETLRQQGCLLDYSCAIFNTRDAHAVITCDECDAILVTPGTADPRQIETLAMRSGVYAAVHMFSTSTASSYLAPLKSSRERAFDIAVVSDPYQGLSGDAPAGVVAHSYELVGINALRYTETNIRLIAQVALETAQGRSRRLTSVDQADRLETMELWRDVVGEAGDRHPDVRVEHLHIEQAIARLVAAPDRFDTIVAGGNLGAVLAAQIGALTGTPGVWARALIGSSGFGIYEIAATHDAGATPGVSLEDCTSTVLNALSLMFRYSCVDPQLEAQTASAWIQFLQEHRPSHS